MMSPTMPGTHGQMWWRRAARPLFNQRARSKMIGHHRFRTCKTGTRCEGGGARPAKREGRANQA